MKRLQLILPAAAVAAALIGCSLGGTTSAGPTSAPATSAVQKPTTVVGVATDTPDISQVPSGGAVQVQINPCDLVPQAEASTLANFQFEAGTVEDNPSGGRRCVYGSQATNVMTVMVAQASDATTAQAYRDAFITDIQSQAAELSGWGRSGDAQLFARRDHHQWERLWVFEGRHLRGDQRRDPGARCADDSGADG
jgi:hypothetical protein